MSILALVFGSLFARAQAPALLWTNNLGATVFAVDDSTNVYAHANGTIFILNANGVPLQTNILSERTGIPLRDTSGDFYFSGIEPGQFPGDPIKCFLARYTSAGSLIWSNRFISVGAVSFGNVTDLQTDSVGNIYVGVVFAYSTGNIPYAAKFDTTGSNVWTTSLPKANYLTGAGTVRFGPLSQTNGYVTTFVNSSFPVLATLSRFDGAGTTIVITNWTHSSSYPALAARPAVDSQKNWFNIEGSLDEGPVLRKRSPSETLLWSQPVGSSGEWSLGRDLWNGVYVGADNNTLTRYGSDGDLIWILNLPSNGRALVQDSQGNRFISYFDGSISRLGAEVFTSITITNPPVGQTVLSGSNAVFSVGASGSAPIRYYWLFNTNPISGATNATLTLSPATPTQAGWYSVIVSNSLGSITSTPALLRVKSVGIYAGSQLLTNGTYTFATSPSLSIGSAYTNGSEFYTLDGSEPSFASIFYTGPFTLSHSATIRALGYSSDFLQSEEADSPTIILLIQHTITTSTSGGGGINLSPPGGIYYDTNLVTATAVPASGWTFLGWLGDASGTNPVINLTTERNKSIEAVFGTALSTTVAGNGQVLVTPPGGIYPYGTVVRLTGVPQAGSYFGFWGNAASGNLNPLYFTVTNPNPTVSSIFGSVPANQAALTVLILGHGQVDVSPRANIFSTNQSVTLTALPDPGQSFSSWSGDVNSSVNPLLVSMTSSKVITAHFSSRPVISVNQPGLEGYLPEGFRFTLIADPQSSYTLLVSSNLTSWQTWGVVTNEFGEVPILDEDISVTPKFYRARLNP
jgi:uncharacterized repeat protein (TIGR02543 family)